MLHPLWPQYKWLHTLWTTYYRHTRQDRWIQTELAFTLAKNATKPNPFEIIPLQTTRKENNWKTEEALARAAVTLQTERIKGSNLWCLWWWCWKCFEIRIILVINSRKKTVYFSFYCNLKSSDFSAGPVCQDTGMRHITVNDAPHIRW